MTMVPGPPVRTVGFDSFDDIPGLPPVAKIDGEGVQFDGNLTPTQVDAVRERITSRDDADQAARAKIRQADAVGATNLASMLRAYVFGDCIPDAVLPK